MQRCRGPQDAALYHDELPNRWIRLKERESLNFFRHSYSVAGYPLLAETLNGGHSLELGKLRMRRRSILVNVRVASGPTGPGAFPSTGRNSERPSVRKWRTFNATYKYARPTEGRNQGFTRAVAFPSTTACMPKTFLRHRLLKRQPFSKSIPGNGLRRRRARRGWRRAAFRKYLRNVCSDAPSLHSRPERPEGRTGPVGRGEGGRRRQLVSPPVGGDDKHSLARGLEEQSTTE
jgi:hypothetical protein